MDDFDRDLDRLAAGIPEDLREEWCVVPRRVLLQAFLAGLLFGGSAVLVGVGFAYDQPALRWAWPVVVVTLMLLTRFVPWWRGDRFEAQARAGRPGAPPPPFH